MKFQITVLTMVLFCLQPFASMAQHLFKGRVLDNYSELPVENATVTINGVTAQAGKDGYFEVTAPGKTPNTIRISHISFRDTILLSGVPEVFQLVKLTRSIRTMGEVIVLSGHTGEELIRKANAAICANYSKRQILAEGYHIARESFNNDRFVYEDTALVKALIPSYCRPGQVMLNLVQNKAGITVRDSSFARTLAMSGGYYFVKGADYVYRQVFSGEHMDQYRFVRKPDSIAANQQLYVVAFQTRAKSDLFMEGTVYIDKTTLAYAAFYVNLVRQPRRTREYAIEKEYASIIVHYKKAANRKYYLQSFFSENTRTQQGLSRFPGIVQAARLKQAYTTLRIKKKGPFDVHALLGETLTFSEISKPAEVIPWKDVERAASGEIVLEN
ncbi:peptidase associated/transthyretin-like domain-containing protein [Niabella drilacis]|uniref:CarboxypepD_reg-like domain-containing protein n=1 Tax=Niabella drilacis (strain DSM 25811 / CCM 8410 / CCUG 62505 / LMG 26954 / E90) TaxID=1285928 RepID=A0A1G6PGF8_NIADE|nr:hypothetical protein [Niabella drilacis]SDC79243.1 hypothetical protein SAMN04487894_10430 [Niabella drilacis]